MAPSLVESEHERLDLVSNTLQLGEFYSVKDILCLKAFLKCFAFASPQMASNGGDNAEEKNIGDAPRFAANESESCHSRYDSVEYVGTIRKGLREILPSLPDQMLLGILGAKIRPSFIKWD